MRTQFLTCYLSFCYTLGSLCGWFVINYFRRHWGMIKESRFIYYWFTHSSRDCEPKDTEFPRIELEHISKHWALLLELTWRNAFSHSRETFKNKAVVCQCLARPASRAANEDIFRCLCGALSCDGFNKKFCWNQRELSAWLECRYQYWMMGDSKKSIY